MDQEKQVQDNQSEFISTPFSISIILFLGFSVIAFSLILSMGLVTTFIHTPMVVGYIIIILFGLVGGFFINHAMNKLKSKSSLSALYGILTPFIPILLIMGVIQIFKKITSQLQTFSSQGTVNYLGGIFTIFNPNLPNPIILSILFYLSFNLFIIIKIIREKTYYILALYLLLPILIFIAWIFISILTSSIVNVIPGF